MDTCGVLERPKCTPKTIVDRSIGEVETKGDRRAPHNGTPDVTICRVHNDFFGALVIDLPADVFD